jgi:hypothetical protein
MIASFLRPGALGAIIVPFLFVAFVLLYLFPDDTRHWWAWDVQPTLTPLMMGAGYIAGGVLLRARSCCCSRRRR